MQHSTEPMVRLCAPCYWLGEGIPVMCRHHLGRERNGDWGMSVIIDVIVFFAPEAG